jgi:hypothetical protein
LDGHLSFQDTDIYRRLYGSLDHTVYAKLTHTDCMNAKLQHQLLNKHSGLATLGHRSICDHVSLPGELNFLHRTFKTNGYSDRSIGLSIHLRRKTNLDRICFPQTFCPLWDSPSTTSAGGYCYISKLYVSLPYKSLQLPSTCQGCPWPKNTWCSTQHPL